MPIENTLITIIIPTYNRSDVIGETLNSILVQTYTNWECIVIDDGSTDNTAEVLSDYISKDKRFRYYKRPAKKLKGPCSCRNYGFEKSTGAYINFFDSDDLYKPQALEKWMSHFNDGVDAVVSKVEMIHFNSHKVSKVYNIASNNLIEDFFVGSINFFVCGPLWRRSFLEKQKVLFNEQIRNGDDWDFNLNLLYQSPKLVLLNTAVVQNRINKNSLSQERNKLNKEELISYFDTIDVQLKKVKQQNTINKLVVNDYVISRYSAYLLMALKHSHNMRFYLYWRLLKKEITLGYYKQLLKTTVGYMSFLIFKKGYNFINFKSRPN